MATESYKLAKQAFHADNAGDSVLNINKVCLTALVRCSNHHRHCDLD